MNTDLIDQLRVYLEIDKHGLDDEIVKQPSLLLQVAEAHAEAIAERDSCKEELATVDAELDGQVRRKLEKVKEKVTEAAVKHGIQTSQKHGDAFDTYMTAKTKADKLLALKEAFQNRSYMLRDLVQLYVANYYDQSSVQGNSRSDSMTYQHNRERLAEARAKRIK